MMLKINTNELWRQILRVTDFFFSVQGFCLQERWPCRRFPGRKILISQLLMRLFTDSKGTEEKL